MKLELLRPFNLEAAKRGEKVCSVTGDELHFIGISLAGSFVIQNQLGSTSVVVSPARDLRMAPLGWCEGRPVYAGDKLWRLGEEYQALLSCDFSQYTWEPPKTKVRYLCYEDGNGWLNWKREDSEKLGDYYKRVPTLDMECES